MTRVRGEVGGTFGSATPEGRERLRRVLMSAAGMPQSADLESAGTGSRLWRPDGQVPFVRNQGQTTADSVRQAADLLWSDADEAVFKFRRGDDAGARESLGHALHGLRASFSPSHVQRVKSEGGTWVIKDVLDQASRGPAVQERGDPGFGEGSAEQDSMSELAGAASLAGQLLQTYFLQRVLGLASEARQTREALERAFLREESS